MYHEVSEKRIEDRNRRPTTTGRYRFEFCPDGFQAQAASPDGNAVWTTASLAASF